MRRKTKITIAVASAVVLLPIAAITMFVLFVGLLEVAPVPGMCREIVLPNQGILVVDGQERGRSEHGFSQSAGYRPPGSAEIEWFGDLSDGVDPQFYQAGSLAVVIDVPAAQIYVRTPAKIWKSMALVFPDDLGPFPLSFYVERNGLTTGEVSRINELGGKRDRKWPTTYIQSFDPETRVLTCSYHVDNKSSWPLRLRLSEDGSHLALVSIGELER
jgi:hypothetical protein